MKIVPFDIKYKPQIESGEYKVLFANPNVNKSSECIINNTYKWPVRIICWDAAYPTNSNVKHPIIGLVTINNYEYTIYSDINGNLTTGDTILIGIPDIDDAHPFDSAVNNLIVCNSNEHPKLAEELLELAIKQLELDGYVILNKDTYDENLKKSFNQGKMEGFNDYNKFCYRY